MPLEGRAEHEIADDWEDFDPTRGQTGDSFWDAFDLDDARANPQPEYGDFWPELDDSELV